MQLSKEELEKMTIDINSKEECSCGKKPIGINRIECFEFTGHTVGGDEDCPIYRCITCGDFIDG